MPFDANAHSLQQIHNKELNQILHQTTRLVPNLPFQRQKIEHWHVLLAHRGFEDE
ncbi:Uncharacterised protein [Legionella pneumophila]|nr:Uncharacterised protein [Legionella pneumophila]